MERLTRATVFARVILTVAATNNVRLETWTTAIAGRRVHHSRWTVGAGKPAWGIAKDQRCGATAGLLLRGGSQAQQHQKQQKQHQQHSAAMNATVLEPAVSSMEQPKGSDKEGNNGYGVIKDIASKVTNAEEGIIPSNDSYSNGTASMATALPIWKARLPEPLRTKRTLHKIRLASVDIYLIGTAHVSDNCSADVRLLLEAVSPDVLFVELCEGRTALLLEETTNRTATNNTPAPAEQVRSSAGRIWGRLRSNQQSEGGGGSRLQELCSAMLSRMQQDYADMLDVEVGGEFRCAYRYRQRRGREDARRPPPPLVLGDRHVTITLMRAWESLTWWPKLKLLAGLLFSLFSKPSPEKLRAWLASNLQDETSDALTKSILKFQKLFPTLYETLVVERDAWLAAKLVQTCRAMSSVVSSSSSTGEIQQQSIVAIVGAGHVPGICSWLTSTNNTQSPEEILSELVQTKRWAKDSLMQNTVIPEWVHGICTMED